MNGIRLIALLLLVGMHAFQVSVVTAAERVALVIGNGKYEHAVELPNPRNDAEDISATLAGLGFEVIKGIDLDHTGMGAKIREFSKAVSQAKLALFFYAGHGMQVNGRNFLIPIDAELADSTALDWEAIDADKVFRHMGSADRVALAFLDACRNNPLARRFASSLGPSRSASIGQGLAAPSTTGTGLFIGFATAPNDVALDGEDRNSPFTQALLKHLPSPGLEIQQLMTRVKADVWEATAGDQQPWHSSDLRSDVYLLPAETVDPKREDQIATDFAVAKEINTEAAWEAFLARHGDEKESFYVQLAEVALTKLAVGIFPREDEPERQNPEKELAEAAKAIRECDELAAHPDDSGLPAGVKGLAFSDIDADQAIPACERALKAEPDNLRLMFQLGRALQKAERHEAAVAAYRQAADRGYASAMNFLGLFYQDGIGVEQDYREARRWYEKAATLGNAMAMNNIGVLYAYGLGVGQDHSEARRWYEKAVALKYATAMNNIGWLYHHGLGVEQDYRQARRWYEKSAALGDSTAMKNVGWLYHTGLGDFREARRWYEMAVALNHSSAMTTLAVLLQEGKGGPRDLTRATELYVTALSLRDTELVQVLTQRPNFFPVEARRAMQRYLIEEGYLNGSADGIIGPATRAALDAYTDAD